MTFSDISSAKKHVLHLNRRLIPVYAFLFPFSVTSRVFLFYFLKVGYTVWADYHTTLHLSNTQFKPHRMILVTNRNYSETKATLALTGYSSARQLLSQLKQTKISSGQDKSREVVRFCTVRSMQSLLSSGNGKILFIVLHSYTEIRKGSPCAIRTQSHTRVSALVNQYFWYYQHVRWSPQNKVFVLTTSAEQAWTRSLIQTKSNLSYKTSVWWRITEYFRLRGPL